ncbi:DUF6443 domain-containing protein [Pedobacter metabolipauper]|uniref:RHS repeat-associated protein n=1 Tax=Pedobacter metabolipauper TaxID=425513 RepID=A0A4R6SU41_9SPHI|nr:DUF6443 domain-containing protein [Pedobacter metabolipauper]TDQ09210.1 RHS repeat-associated protein [Pedobacter metabolipauper]
MKKILYLTILYVTGITGVQAQTPNTNQNYIIVSKVKAANRNTAASLAGLPVDSVNKTIQYIDGLGRLLQTVQWQASPNKKDIVLPVEYDVLGREVKKYLPYADASGNDGTYRVGATATQGNFYGTSSWDANVVRTQHPYSVSVFESSPLNRVLEQGAPGLSWQPAASRTATTGRTVVIDQTSNITDEVMIWEVNANGASATNTYPANTLYKTIIKDENWVSGRAGTTEEFKDLEGQVLVKRIWKDEGTVLSTYYVYDVLGNLRYVLPPGVGVSSFTEADPVFTNFIYGYRYDSRRRVIEKKIPGKGGWDQFVYNNLGQVVLTRDPVQAQVLGAPYPYFGFTKYDGLGRVIMTGVERQYDQPSSAIQAHFDNNPNLTTWEDRSYGSWFGYTLNALPTGAATMDVQVVNYYDDYNIEWMPENLSANYSNKTKGLLTATRVKVLGSAGDYLWTINYYDDKGRVVRIYKQHYLPGSINEKNYDEIVNTYNFAGELIKSTRRHYVLNQEKLYVYNEYTYDHQGRVKLVRQKTGDNPSTTNPLVTLSNQVYNEIGQLKEKQLHNGLQSTKYAYNERGWLKQGVSGQFSMKLGYDTLSNANPQYNGNIASQNWGTGLTNKFTYTYDKLNRLTKGISTGIVMKEEITYDNMGNIASMNRNDQGISQYYYQNANGNTGNRLSSISAGSIPMAGTYAYDLNGNATTDGRTGAVLTYNNLNLPVTATRAGSFNITYTYDGTGRKIKKASSLEGSSDYIDGIHYNAGVLKFIQTSEGLARKSGTSYSYEYDLKDHLGNVRYSFRSDPNNPGQIQKLQEDNYHPFGQKNSVMGGTNNYLYNGKELQNELEQYDYGARFYDPVIARWNVIDPMAEKYYSESTYNYVGNNPIGRVDLDGMEWENDVERKKGETIQNGIVKTNEKLVKKNQHLAAKVREASSKGKESKVGRLVNKIADNVERINTNVETVNAIDQIGAVEGIKFALGDGVKITESGDNQIQTTTVERREDGTYVINNSGSLGNQAHELTHGGQIARGEVSLSPGTKRIEFQNRSKLNLEADGYRANYGVSGRLPFNGKPTDTDYVNKLRIYLNR